MKNETFKSLSQELEAIIDWFEQDDVDLDQAVEKFERGLAISQELQKRLAATEQKITKLSESV